MSGKVKILLIVIIFIFHSCSREDPPVIPPAIKIYTEKYLLEITEDFKIKKVSLLSYEPSRYFTIDYFYYTDSVVSQWNQMYLTKTVYYLNRSSLCDSSQSFTNNVISNTRLYYSYNAEGYLISRKEKYLNSTLEFTETYEYRSGNLTRVIFDTKKPTLTGKYALYTYTDFQNPIDIRGFRGPWLGKLNLNLVKTYYVGGSMSDVPPCSNYEYSLNAAGLVETMTVFPCNSTSYKTIVSFEYVIKD